MVVSQMLLVETSKLTGAFEATDTSGVQIGLACCSTHLVACLACRAEGILTCCKVPTAAATIYLTLRLVCMAAGAVCVPP